MSAEFARCYEAGAPLGMRALISDTADLLAAYRQLVRKLASGWEITDDNRLVLPIPDGHGGEFAWITHRVSAELADLFKEVTA